MKSFLFLSIFGLFFNLYAGVEESITDMMVKNSQKVTSILKDKTISKKKQDEQLIKIVDPLFDFKLMGTLCLGKTKRSKTLTQENFIFTPMKN